MSDVISGVKYVDGTIVGKKYKAGMTFSFRLAIPAVERDEYALLIEHDGLIDANVESMKKLADEGNAPYCVCVGVMPGIFVFPDGEERDMRLNSYDLFNSEYGDFLVYELIPYIEKEFNIRFFKSPDMHYVSGGSSGGISAFVIAWFHSEYFHRIYMSSPSFLAMGRGNEIPYLIRKYETKPFRIYEEYSEDEPNDYFGASYPIDVQMKMGLEFAGYDFTWKYFPKEGHCSRYWDAEEAYVRNKWIWQDYAKREITAPRNSPRVDKIVEASGWEKADIFPKKAEADMCVSGVSGNYSCMARSADKKVCYAADKDSDVVYAHFIENDVCTEKRFLHGMLHTFPQVEPRGAIDMAVDSTDRLYVLTAVGIQCIRAYGLIDVILALPEGRPQKIAVSDALYVKTDKGIYKRSLKSECLNSSERKYISYYD